MFSAFYKHVTSFKAVPSTKAEVKANQKMRHEALMALKSGPVAPDARAAVKLFWATQTYFFVKLLSDNRAEFSDVQFSDFTKGSLIHTIQQFISKLDEEYFASRLISILTKDCRFNIARRSILIPPAVVNQEPISTGKPDLYFRVGDSIRFSSQQADVGKKVLIMDAANAQRPGAGGYEQGTFQEALTRHTDLYWKFIVDFRNVFSDLETSNNTIFPLSDEDSRLLVWSYQARFIKLILECIKDAIKDEHFCENAQFTKKFFTAAGSIYGEMQNTVFEIPSLGGFLKNCRIIDLGSAVKSTSDLFAQDVFRPELLSLPGHRVFIIETAAPDKRKIEGGYDRACTFNTTLRTSLEDDVANRMITSSLEFTLREALDNHIDVVILNAFGCGAFKNDPETVANLFVTVLQKYTKQLAGKEIYFMDLNQEMVWAFGRIMSSRLASDFNINPHRADGVVLVNVCVNQITGVPNHHQGYILNYGHNQTCDKSDTSFEHHAPTNLTELTNLYFHHLSSLTLKKIDEIHTVLIGSGKLKFSINDCVAALLAALNMIRKDYSSIPSIYLHVSDQQTLLEVTRCLETRTPAPQPATVTTHTPRLLDGLLRDNCLAPSLSNEIVRYYTIYIPQGVTLSALKAKTSFQMGRPDAPIEQDCTRISEHLYLGKIPTKEEAVRLKKMLKNLKRIVAVVEAFELAGYGLVSTLPIQTPLEWKTMGVKHHQLVKRDDKTDDFPIRLLIQTVVMMRQDIENGEDVYVHCKAGKSRSPTVILLYLALFGAKREGLEPGLESYILHKYMLSLRPQIALHDYHYDVVERAKQLTKQEPHLLRCHLAQDVKESIPRTSMMLTELVSARRTLLHTYLFTSDFKIALMQLSWFKQIKLISFSDSSQKHWVQFLLNNLLNATLSSDYFRLLKSEEIFNNERGNLYQEMIHHLTVKFELDDSLVEAAMSGQLPPASPVPPLSPPLFPSSPSPRPSTP
jgi:protein-tyrosine phosphatase